MNCTRCDGTGFLNLEQVDVDTLHQFEVNDGDPLVILDWIEERNRRMKEAGGCTCHISPPCSVCTELAHDVSVCDCCGDGGDWYYAPGQHDLSNPDDPGGCR